MCSTAPKFTELNELASQRDGGKILFATDDWFAEAENLLSGEEPVFKPDIYTDYGKWMDGWETRRRRTPGHDWCIIKLGIPGVIRGVEVDTAFFTGNFTPRISIQAARLTSEDEKLIPPRKPDNIGTACTREMLKQMEALDSENWTEILPMCRLQAGYPDSRRNYFEIDSGESWSALRLNMYPDGGIARLRVYGEARTNLEKSEKVVDLIAMKNGGVCRGYSNAHYGHPRNLIRAGRGLNMGDGWETARRLDRPAILQADQSGILKVPGNEWAVFRLGAVGKVSHIEVDTKHFKGNFPDSMKLEGMLLRRSQEWDDPHVDAKWVTIVPASKLSSDAVHRYTSEDIKSSGPFSHARITIAPDGGVSRLRIFGIVVPETTISP